MKHRGYQTSGRWAALIGMTSAQRWRAAEAAVASRAWGATTAGTAGWLCAASIGAGVAAI